MFLVWCIINSLTKCETVVRLLARLLLALGLVAHMRAANAASSLTPPRLQGHALFVPTGVGACRQGLQTQATHPALGRRKNRNGILVSYF